MNAFNKLFLLTIFIVFNQLPAQNKLHLPALISDNMVLQQNSVVPLWGWARPGDKLAVRTSWDKKDYSAVAGVSGRWEVRVHTPEAGGPYSLSINDLTIKNVLIGEVWVCSGQSNMQWPLSSSMNAREEIAEADYPQIRLFYVARQFADEPKSDCYGKWDACTPQTAPSFSAVAYFFGRELHKTLDVPIGLIHTSWGGTPAEAWTKQEILENDPQLRVYLDRFEEKIAAAGPGVVPRDQRSPSGLYNAMIAPLIPFTIRGAIWYQGEANVREADLYEKLFPTMITSWRQDWGLGDFPFYYVQLAPYSYDTPVVGAALRDAQRKTLKLKNTGMAVTLDIGNPDNIHPRNKQDVGKRLALWALARDYGRNLVYSGPLYKSMKIEGQKIRVRFDNTGSGLVLKGGTPNHFEIAGTDRVFYPAEAAIENESIVVFSDRVKKPVAVRYAFSNTAEAQLFNKEGLPASSFRSDNWPILVIPVQISGHYDRKAQGFRIKLSCSDSAAAIHYSVDGSQPTLQSKRYAHPFILKETALIKARAFKDGAASLAVAGHRFTRHLATGKKIELKWAFSPKYPASGQMALIDGLSGSANFHDGIWQGFEKVDLDATIDLEKSQTISRISCSFLQDMNSWIFLPEKVAFEVSQDGQNFRNLAELDHDVELSRPGSIIKRFSKKFESVKGRFVRVRAKNVAVCPAWHPGAGGMAWLFVDEIIIE